MKQRVLSTVLLWGTIVASLYWGGKWAGLGLLVVVNLLALIEFFEIFCKMGYMPYAKSTMIVSVGLLVGTLVAPKCPLAFSGAFLGVGVSVLALSGLRHVTQPEWLRQSFFPTLFGFLYIPYLLHFFVVLLKIAPSGTGLGLVIWVIAMAKFTDVGALLVGSWIGKHRMAPSISPKKSWEGAVGGICTAMGVGYIGWHFGKEFLPALFDLPTVLLWAVVIGIVSIFSDLFESLLKRWANVKDSGAKLPGIGGVLDLVDSLLFVAPVAYILYRFL